MKGKLRWIFGCLGCAGLAGGGCFIAFIIFIVSGLDQPRGPNLWYRLPGYYFSAASAECETEWEEEGDRLRCEELAQPVSVATGTTTAVEVTFDASKRVKAVHLRMPDYKGRIEQSDEGYFHMMSLSESVVDDIDLSGCKAEFVPYAQGGLWRCEELVYGYLMGHKESGMPTMPHLWIGRSFEDFKDSFHAVGQEVLKDEAESRLMLANEPNMLSTPVSMDVNLVNAYFFFAQLSPKSQATRAKLREIRRLREENRERAREYREHMGIAGPLPHRTGLMQFGHLFAVDKEVLEGFLGEPSGCKGEECTYPNEVWDMKVTYDGETPERLVLTVAPDDSAIPFDEGALAFFDLLPAPAASRTEDRIVWEDIGGLSRLEVQAKEGGNVTRVVASR